MRRLRHLWPLGVFLLLLFLYDTGTLLWLAERVTHQPSFRWYQTFQSDSDGLVTARLVNSLTNGVLANGAFLGTDGTYISQVGLSGWVITLPPALLGLRGAEAESFMHFLASAANAAMATGAIVAIRRALGRGPALVLGVGLVQPWPTVMANSTYWLIGLKLLPAAGLIWLIATGRDSARSCLVVALTSMALVALSGYEYVTVSGGSALAVVFALAAKRRLGIRAGLPRLVATATGVLGGFAAAVAIHLAILTYRYGSLRVAVDTFIYVAARRVAVTDVAGNEVLAVSLAASPPSVLDPYLTMPLLESPASLPILHSITVGGFLLLCLTVFVVWLGVRSRQADRDDWYEGLFAAWVVSLLGPIGWHLLARPHSYHHLHINPVLWYLPTIPLGLALLWEPIAHGLIGLRGRRTALLALGVTLVGLGVALAYSYATVRR